MIYPPEKKTRGWSQSREKALLEMLCLCRKGAGKKYSGFSLLPPLLASWASHWLKPEDCETPRRCRAQKPASFLEPRAGRDGQRGMGQDSAKGNTGLINVPFCDRGTVVTGPSTSQLPGTAPV